MLTLTDTAATVVKTIVGQNPELTEGGIRIDSAPGAPADFAVGVAPAPSPGDAVVDTEGARVFLGEDAAIALDDKVLDAKVGENGSVTFAIANQD